MSLIKQIDCMESCHGTFICTSQSTDTGFLVGVRRLADGAPTENPPVKLKKIWSIGAICMNATKNFVTLHNDFRSMRNYMKASERCLHYDSCDVPIYLHMSITC